MNEEAQEITVNVKPIPDEPTNIPVKIKPNAKVSELEGELKGMLNDLNVSVGILKFNGQELDNKDKTLEELGIEDGSSVENENRVVGIRFLHDSTIICITCDEDTTIRKLLKQLKGKNPSYDYGIILYAGEAFNRSILDQKLLGYKIGTGSIKYGAVLNFIIESEKHKNCERVFDLNNLEESKNSNYPLPRIIVGIAALFFLALAVALFVMTHGLITLVPIFLTVFFVFGVILFSRWNTILPKILSKSCLKKINLGADLGKKNNHEIDEKENNQKDNPAEEEKKDEKEEEAYDSL